MQYDSAGTLSSISASARIVGSAYETAKMKHSTHNALALLASLLAVSLIVSALRQRRLSAGPPRRAKSIRVGFVGNSFTYYNDLPGVLSRATGVAVDACTRGGASLASLLRDGGDGTGLAAVRFAKAALARARGAAASKKEKAEAAEAQRVADATNKVDVPAAARDLRAFLGDVQRDVVVVQDFSRGPIKNRDEGVSALQQLAPLLREARVVVFYSTWAYDNALTRADEDLRDTTKMARGLAEGYEEYARALQDAGVETIAIAPVGAAFELVRAEDEALWRSLFARDGYHPSPVGTYLAARVLHETIATALGRVAEITWDQNVPEDSDLADLADAARRACEPRPASSMGML